MGLLSRLRGKRAKQPASLDRASTRDDRKHLTEFARTRRGVEAYVEPRTNVTEMTVVLVAADGEWTRRRISGESEARKLGTDLKIPVYDAGRTGYPQRMRDWSARRGSSS